MVGVAVAAHYVVGLSWAPAFVLGAVVSPTDPIAATSIAHRLGVPRRAIAIVEGESLVNDGTALVLFKFAAAAVVAGSFSLAHAAGDFVWTVVGGIAVGLADRARDPLHPLPGEQPAARGDDRVPHRLHRLPARSGDRRLRRARGRDGGRLHGLAHARADERRHAAAGRRLLGDLQLPAERAPLRARRPPAQADPRPAARPLLAAARRLRGAPLGRRDRRQVRVRVPDRARPALGLAKPP